MAAFNISLSKTRCDDIPTEALRRKHESEIASNVCSVKKSEIQEFVELVGKKGYSFCPSTFKNACQRKDTFKQSQLFALFFNNLSHNNKKRNNSFSFDDIAQRARKYNLPIFFAYDVFSSFSWEPNHQLFCIVFLNEIPICSFREAEAIQKALLTIFPESDQKHGSVIDLYFGGNSVLYYDETMPTINPDVVFMGMCLCLKNRHGATNYKRKVVSFAEETGILLDSRNLPVVSLAEELINNDNLNIEKSFDEESYRDSHQKDDKKSPKPTIYRIGDYGEKLSRLSYIINFQNDITQKESDQSTSPTKPNIHQPYRSDVIKSISFNCELYHEFESANTDRRLTHQELLGLATNLARVESGRKVFLSILRSKSFSKDDGFAVNNWDYYFYYFKQRSPYPCSSFCPYHKTCTHGKNILSTCSIRPHQIERVSDNEEFLVSLDEAIEDFEKAFNTAVNSSENIWHIIKSQTALGKTQTLLQLLKDHPDMNVLIVVPTNKLKREIAERAEEMGIPLYVSPSLHEIGDALPSDVWEDIVNLLNSGKSPIPRIIKAIENEKKRDAAQLKKYLSERDTFYSSTGCAITTHRRLTSIDLSKYDLVIIDEDYIFSTVLMDKTSITLSDLKKLKNRLPARDSLCAKIKKILRKSELHKFFTVNEVDYNESYTEVNTEINIRALCEGTHFCYLESSRYGQASIAFTKRPHLPDGVKIIMLSATANEDICKYCFGEEKVRFYDCKAARLTGNLYQHYKWPMSRAYLDEHPKVMEQIKSWSGFEHTITFKKYTDFCTDGMYFGNCVGCDVLKGENIDVIGTPHQPEWVYKLFAFTLGFDVTATLNPCSIVTNNGYRFRFATFDDEILRTIQFYIIETDLEQAVGRARLLRCDATVNLFSNFPLRQAILKESEYDKE